MSGANIGIMDPAYFVGRKEILTWINDTLSLNLGKIEDTASGAVACQIADMIYPGDVSMSKVKWDTRSDHEFINNYKILQRVFDKRGIEKHIEVEKLCRAKYQDNLEFMQWLKSFYDKNYNGAPYDPIARRAVGKGASAVASGPGVGGGGAGIRKPTAVSKAPSVKPSRGGSGTGTGTGTGTESVEGDDSVPLAPPKPKPTSTTAQSNVNKRPSAVPSSGGDGTGLNKRVEQLDAQVADLKLSVEGLEKERDFYFGKLRDIEILLQAYNGPDPQLSKQVFDILYATEEDFVIADDAKENTEA